MTKQEALQKIEELQKFVDDLDKQSLKHGDLVCYFGSPQEKRIIIDVRKIIKDDLDNNYLFLDNDGNALNNCQDLSDLGVAYIKIRNVFED